ncbi:MAG: acetyl-CoA carboxylase biotin carboxyl carrier protein subunit [Alphaproteobacteria bacterium]|nr:acetyl-CoA carboxylase biotin carboxyl carrier protein subunit [Alphaproteobacteria bacterium]
MTSHNKKDSDIVTLENIVTILKDNNLNKIVYETNELKVEVVAMQQCQSNNINIVRNTPSTNIVKQDVDKNMEQDLSKHIGAVKSPMVGTCYLAPEPGAKKFIEVGDTVKKGQPLLIIEAMKVMNYIRAKNDGKVINILVKDAQPVEYGQLLLVIE